MVQPGYGKDNLLDETKKYLKEKYNKPGNVFLGLVHRLDNPVSGIVLFGKTSKGASRLSEQFRNREIEKIYMAVVEGKMENDEGELRNLLSKDTSSTKAVIGESLSSPELGDEATLHYQVISSTNKYSLLKINLETGRFHQIRAQLSAIGHPIVGDIKYGSKEKLKDGSIALCATEIIFKTATTEEIKDLRIELPPAWAVLGF